MERAVIAAVVVVVAVVVAVIVERRRPKVGPGRTWVIPGQIDRADFPRPEAPWLVAVFTASSCSTCAQAVTAALPLDGDNVVVEEVELGAAPDLHRRYGIDAVPTLVLADSEGVVRASFVGPPNAVELWNIVLDTQNGRD